MSGRGKKKEKSGSLEDLASCLWYPERFHVRIERGLSQVTGKRGGQEETCYILRRAMRKNVDEKSRDERCWVGGGIKGSKKERSLPAGFFTFSQAKDHLFGERGSNPDIASMSRGCGRVQLKKLPPDDKGNGVLERGCEKGRVYSGGLRSRFDSDSALVAWQ